MYTIRSWLKSEGITHIYFPNVNPYDHESGADYGLEAFKGLPEGTFGWDDPRIQPFLDIPFSTGFGTAHVPMYVAWCPTHVHYVHEYDGSTSPCSVPRNPN